MAARRDCATGATRSYPLNGLELICWIPLRPLSRLDGLYFQGVHSHFTFVLATSADLAISQMVKNDQHRLTMDHVRDG